MRTLPINTFLVLGCGALAIAAGNTIHAHSRILRRWLIPAPIVAGLLLAVPTLIFRSAGYALEVDPTLQQVSLVAFFTSIGFNLDGPALRRGGTPVAIMLMMYGLGALLQNCVGVLMAGWLGLHPLIGIATGAVALAGGPATSLAFGPTLEEAGARGATSVALASAIIGILTAGATTGGLGALLIRRDALFSRKKPTRGQSPEQAAHTAETALLAKTLVLFGVAMGFGYLLNLAILASLRSLSISLPAYIGAMLVAAAIRAGASRFPALDVSRTWNETLGSVALSWFIPLALWTLRYWEIEDLAGPVLLILLVQFPTTIALAWITYRLIGKSFESAVMASGYFGFMYGTMANSLAAMKELSARFIHSPQAFLVVSLAGGVLGDFANVIAIVFSRVLVSAWMR
jgi:ESS family glutamate:Na+ symporter